MKRLLLLAALLVAGCASPAKTYTESEPTYVDVFHDTDRGVTCWIWSVGYQGGISCLPDWQLEKPKP